MTDAPATPITSPVFPSVEGFTTEEIQNFNNFLAKDYPHATIRYYASGYYTIAHKLIFHWTVKSGVVGDYFGYEDRFCFATEKIAIDAIKNWNNPKEDCPGQWHRHPKSGRRRQWNDDGTFHEYIAP